MSIRLEIIYLDDSERNTALYLSSIHAIADTISVYNSSYSHTILADRKPYYVKTNEYNRRLGKKEILYYNQQGKQITEQELKILKIEYLMHLND